MEQLKKLVVGGRECNGQELLAEVLRCAGGLAKLGCKRGDTVAMLMRNSREQLVATLATQYLGAYPVQMNWHSQTPELAYVLRDCGARILFVHRDLAAQVGGDLLQDLSVVAIDPDVELRSVYRLAESYPLPAGAWDWNVWLIESDMISSPPVAAVESIIYTSGTTGHPKGVRRFEATPQQREMTETMRSQVFGIGPDSRVLVAAPIYHTAPHLFSLRAVRIADTLVLRPRFEPEGFLADIERFGITHVYVVPTIFVRLLALPQEIRNRNNLSSLRFVLHAGGPCAPHLKKAMIDWLGPIIHEYYGSTEAGPATFCDSEDSLRHPGTVGRAAPGVHIDIQDEHGQSLGIGEIGEVCTRNDGYADFTYLHRDEDRRQLQRGEYLSSGDLGYLDEKGYLYLCDRKRDLVISGGVNIYPAEIEAVILELQGVADCVVFGIPDAEFGESLAALIEPLEANVLTTDDVITHLTERLAAFKVPRVIEIRHSLPRDESGKIKKRVLREPYWQDAGRKI